MILLAILAGGVISKSQGQTSPEFDVSAMFQSNRTRLLIPDIQGAYGVVFRDMDGDQRPDLYLVSFRGINRLLLNRGARQRFEDATIASGLGGNLMPMDTLNLELSAAAFDWDNDGDRDLVISGWGETTAGYLNLGRARFADVSHRMELSVFQDANHGCVADVDGNGFPDLFLADEHYTNRMMLNDGKGQFKDGTRRCGLYFYGVSQSAGFCDIDLDGDADLYVANLKGPDLFYQNRGDGRFRLMDLKGPLFTQALNTQSVTFGDVDNDGDFDFFVACRSGANHLYLNETVPGDSVWAFQPVLETEAIQDSGNTYGAVLADFNHDGWLDLFVTNLGPNTFYLSRRGRFHRVWQEASSPSAMGGYSTGAAAADYDGDGDPDLVVANRDTFALLLVNPVNNQQFIKFRVLGIRSHRDAFGARVTLWSAGHMNEPRYFLGVREVGAGAGYLSSGELAVHFGLGPVQKVDAVVRYPSGREVVRTNLPAGLTVTVYEYGGLSRWGLALFRNVRRLIYRAEFWHAVVLVTLFIGMLSVMIFFGLKRYRWNAGRTSRYLAAFFILAYLMLLIFHRMGLKTVLLVIDLLTGGLLIILGFYTERLLRMKRMSSRYQSVLVSLSRQIVGIHDDGMLLETVVKNIAANSEFSPVCAFLYSEETERFTLQSIHGCQINAAFYESLDSMPGLVARLRENPVLDAGDLKSFAPLVGSCGAVTAFSLARPPHFYGFFTLGHRPLSREDEDLFQSLASQMAVAAENNAHTRRSIEMIRKLTEAQVRQKYLDTLETKNRSLDETNQKLRALYDELKHTESQLIHSEKMASLGQLVAGISHELNNPVAFIYANVRQLQAYVDRILKALDAPGQSPDALSQIRPDLKNLMEDTLSGTRMVKELVTNLKTFSHLDQAEKKVSNVHEGLKSCLMIARPSLKERITVETHFQGDGLLECNIGQLNQVFLNLIINAAQAMEEGGTLRLETRRTGEAFYVSVQDTGAGIQPEVVTKIFDPFFTTKEVGQGMGLGLSISYSIVKNHGGRIEVESEPGQGSRFLVVLPLSGGKA